MVSSTENDSLAEPGAASIFGYLAAWVSAAGRRVDLLSELVLAEAKLAAISISLMAFLAMLAAAFVLIAWGLLMAGLIFILARFEVLLWPVFLVLGAAHGLIAWLAWKAAVGLSRHLEFPVTRHQLHVATEEIREVA